MGREDRRPAPGAGDQIGGTHALTYRPDGRFLAVARGPVAVELTGQLRYTVSLWDARMGALVENLVEADLAETWQIQATSFAFSVDGRYLAAVYGKQIAL